MPRTTVAMLEEQIAELRSENEAVRKSLSEMEKVAAAYAATSHNLAVASGNTLAAVKALAEEPKAPVAPAKTPSGSKKQRPANKGAKPQFDDLTFDLNFVEDGQPRLTKAGRHNGYGVANEEPKASLRVYNDDAFPVGDSIDVLVTSGADKAEGLVLYLAEGKGKMASYEAKMVTFGFAEGAVEMDAYLRVPRTTRMPKAVTVYFTE